MSEISVLKSLWSITCCVLQNVPFLPLPVCVCLPNLVGSSLALQRRGQPCVWSEQRPGPPGAGQSCSDSSRHPEDHVLRLSCTHPSPSHFHPSRTDTNRAHLVCHSRSPHSCKSHPATHLVNPDLTLCRGKQGGKMGRGRQTPHWTDNANAAFENKQERNSALLCNIKPANYFIFHPYQPPPHHRPCLLFPVCLRSL